MSKKLTPIHPGEIIRDALDDAGIIGVIVEGNPITKEIAHILARAFDTTPEYWLNMQAHYDKQMADLLRPRLDVS